MTYQPSRRRRYAHYYDYHYREQDRKRGRKSNRIRGRYVVRDSFDKSIYVARLSRIISHAIDNCSDRTHPTRILEKRGRSFFEEEEEEGAQVYVAYAFFEINEPRGCLGEERTAFLDTLPERDLIVRENKP